MIAIGLGCRRGAAADEVIALVREAAALLPDSARPCGLFTVADKRGEPGLAAAAGAFDLPLVFLDRALLALVAGDARSCSRRVEELFGLPGIAETAALTGAGGNAVLLVPRRASAAVTCAIAGPPATKPSP